MRLLITIALLPLLAVLTAPPVCAQVTLGPSGVEGEPLRRQEWRVPSPDTGIAVRALLFRPPGAGPFRLAVIAHASTQNVLRRAQMPQPEYRPLAAFLVARGFAVLVPERLGHGATGGRYVEDQGGCDEADYARSGRATAEQIRLALEFLRKQDFIRKEDAVVIGHSAGGWGALALADADPKTISAVIAFAPGRGGHANDEPNKICAPHTLLAAAAEFGRGARIPVTWLVAANDSYFAPAFSKSLADAFRGGGGKVDFRTLPAVGSEGHWMIESEAGVKAAGSDLARALTQGRPMATRKPWDNR
ncbi:MAG: alpha/beta fold hydrolase [Bradyrhizobiaceae bacterium]|nr:MAG: alpha/beta fold hydrolase [Bradyrhizobiaceae bacterium]